MSLVIEIGKIRQALHNADPADKAEVYGPLGPGPDTDLPSKRKAGRSRSPTRVDRVHRNVSEVRHAP